MFLRPIFRKNQGSSTKVEMVRIMINLLMLEILSLKRSRQILSLSVVKILHKLKSQKFTMWILLNLTQEQMPLIKDLPLLILTSQTNFQIIINHIIF